MADTGRAARSGLMARLGLDRQELRAWAMYDWANSAFQCTIITAVFPVYYSTVAARGLTGAEATARFATATTLALTFIAIVSPILGAYADFAGAKKRMLGRLHGRRRRRDRGHGLHWSGRLAACRMALRHR